MRYKLGAQGIKNTVVTSIIHGYGVEKQKNSTQKREKRKKENLSIPLKPNSQIKIYFHKRRKKKKT
jgi:hypothetical protein